MWTVNVPRRALRAVARAPRRDVERIFAALEEMRLDPHRGDVVPFQQQQAAWRRRVGDWRIFFDLDPNRRLVEVVAIERRTSTTYRRR